IGVVGVCDARISAGSVAVGRLDELPQDIELVALDLGAIAAAVRLPDVIGGRGDNSAAADNISSGGAAAIGSQRTDNSVTDVVVEDHTLRCPAEIGEADFVR